MNNPVVARVWFGLTALAVFAGIAVQLRASALLVGNVNFPDLPGRLANVFAYFTVQSNVLVGVIRPFSRAAVMVTILFVEPGSNTCWMLGFID